MVRDKLAGALLLKAAFQELKSMDPRRDWVSQPFDDDFDADIDLWEEDSYVAGLVTSVLDGKSLDARYIEIDYGIDARFSDLVSRSTGSMKRKAESYLEYRKKMIRVVRLLSQLTSVPIKGAEV